MKTQIILLCLLSVALAAPRSSADPLTLDNLRLGDSNTFGDSGSPLWGELIGDSNSATGSSYLIVGLENTPSSIGDSIIAGEFNDGNYYASLVAGAFNDTGELDYGFVAGYNNSMVGYFQFGMGRGLISPIPTDWNENTAIPSIYLGRYNDVNQSSTPPLLVVGNGSDANHRSNAWEIYPDGKIKIPKRQGDIVMGEFGNGNGD